MQGDDDVWPWYGLEKPTLEQARRHGGAFMGESWQLHGVAKWIAYDRVSGQVVGRGGLSRTPVDDDWGQLYEFLRRKPWVRAAHKGRTARSWRTRAGWRSAGRCAAGSGGVATRPRSGAPGWSSRSASSGREPWCRAPSGTTSGRARSWSASACGTPARSAAAASSKGWKESRTTRRSLYACCCEKTEPARRGSWGRVRTSIAANQNNIGWSERRRGRRPPLLFVVVVATTTKECRGCHNDDNRRVHSGAAGP